MYPARVRENACPPITTFQRIMKTPNKTSVTPTMVLLMVRPGMRNRTKGTRLPRPYWRTNILVKSLPKRTLLNASHEAMPVYPRKMRSRSSRLMAKIRKKSRYLEVILMTLISTRHQDDLQIPALLPDLRHQS